MSVYIVFVNVYLLLIMFIFCPSRGLVPLHNACSYGHYEVTELLLKVHSHMLSQRLLKHTLYNIK